MIYLLILHMNDILMMVIEMISFLCIINVFYFALEVSVTPVVDV